jgi:hypothetical protein
MREGTVKGHHAADSRWWLSKPGEYMPTVFPAGDENQSRSTIAMP